jgi:hypothetical protein
MLWRISHLGKNPVNGGKPPKDKMEKCIKICFEELKFTITNWLIWEILKELKIKITASKIAE